MSDAPNEHLPLEALLAGYGAAAAGFDEMLAPDGEIRPHWRCFVDGFVGMGPAGRAAAGESTRRLLRERHRVQRLCRPRRPGACVAPGPGPVLLPDAEWGKLAAGILQRARLIDAVLADLHGTQRLLQDGSLPASLLLGSPAFVRTSVDREAPDRRFLYAYACDVARTASGEWVILGDQTDTAIGHGYALASRVALSHGLAQLFRDCRTRRLAGHFLRLQESFQGLCGRDDGRIVILSPGPAEPVLLQPRLPRPLSRLHGGRERRPHRARQSGLPEDAGRAAAGLSDRGQAARSPDGPAAPAGQRAREHPGAGPGREERHRRDGQSAWQRRGANHALAPFAAGLCRRLLGEALLADVPTRWLGTPDAAAAALREPERWA